MSVRSIPRFALAGLLAAALAAPAVAQPPEPEAPMPRALPRVVMSSPVAPFWWDAEPPVVYPQKAPAGAIEIELSLDLLKPFGIEVQTQWALGATPAVAPMPREARGGCCGAECCRQPAAVKVRETRTGQFVVSGGVNSDAGLTGNIELNERNFDILRTAAGGAPGLRIAVPALGPLPVALDAVPLSRTPADHRQMFNFAVGLFGDDCPARGHTTTGGVGARLVGPTVVQAAAPQGNTLTVFGPGTVVTGNVIEFAAGAPNPLAGTWYRDTGAGVVAVTFTPDEMKLCLTQREGGNTATFTITAHYTLTKDGLVYGAVTGADVDAKLDGKAQAELGMELAEMSLMLQELTDRPFSFRTKATSAGLMVSQMKVASGEQIRGQELAVLGGLYKFAKDGKVPAPTEPKPAAGRTGRADCQLPQLCDLPLTTLPTVPAMSEPIQRVGVDFSLSGQPVMTPPAGAPQAIPVCNDAMKSMAADAFGQMLKPASGTVMGGMTLPSGRYLEHFPEYFAPEPCYPDRYESTARQAVVAPFAVQVANGTSVAKPAHVGTWVRMIGSKQCVVKVEADHLTITVSEARDVEGATVTGHLTFTADYHLTRDGLTAVGLITSVDAKFDGDMPEDDEQAMTEKVAEMQKALEEKPFALTFRRYGEALVIGNVRMSDVGDRMELPPGAYIGGRYASVGDKPLPKLKVVKVTEPRPTPVYGPPPAWPGVIGAPVQPGTYELPAPAPQLPPRAYFPPPTPTNELLPPQALPCPTAPRPVGAAVPAPRQRVIAEDLPAPSPRVIPYDAWAPSPAVAPARPMTMPQPIPPAVSSDERKIPQATEMAIAWRPKVENLPDPTRNGAKVAGLAGQLFLFAGPKLEFAPADGTLTVDLIDATPRPAGQPTATAERWQFDKEALNKLFTTDETFGKSYVLFLPWPAYKSDITKVKISVRYDPKDGHTLYAAPKVISFDSAKDDGFGAVTAVMPQPIPPAVSLEESVPPMAEPAKPAKKQKKAKPSPDPVGRVQQVLDGHQALTRIREETAVRTPVQRQIFSFVTGVFGSQ